MHYFKFRKSDFKLFLSHERFYVLLLCTRKKWFCWNS